MQTVKWLSYDFGVYDDKTTWNNVAGIYIFCKIVKINQQEFWKALYIGQADSFEKRLRLTSHEQWIPAVRLGATHIHAMAVPLQANRDLIEKQLIQTFDPPLNVQLKR